MAARLRSWWLVGVLSLGVLARAKVFAAVDLETINPNTTGQWSFAPVMRAGFPAPTVTTTPAATTTPVLTGTPPGLTAVPTATATPLARPTAVAQIEGELHVNAREDGWGLLQSWGRGPAHLWVRELPTVDSERGLCGWSDADSTPCASNSDCTGHADPTCYHVHSGQQFSLLYNLDPFGTGLPETGRQGGGGFASDAMSVDFNGDGSTNEISLSDRHSEGPRVGAQNRLGVNIVRSFFGPDDGTPHSGDAYRRLGPSAKGAHPESVTQSYEVLGRSDQDMGSLSGTLPVCASTIAGFVHACNNAGANTDLAASYVGLTEFQGGAGIGSLMYIIQNGYVEDVVCTGTIHPTDRLRVGSVGAVIADNDASGSATIGIAASSCTGTVDVWLTHKGAASTKLWIPAGNCRTGTGTMDNAWSTVTSPAAPSVGCASGTNTAFGTLDFADSAVTCVQTTAMLPTDWAGTVTAKLRWFTTATSGSAYWSIGANCVADAVIEDPAFTAASSMLDQAKPTASQMNDKSVSVGPTVLAGCAAGNLMHVQLCRQGTDALDTLTSGAVARLVGLELVLSR